MTILREWRAELRRELADEYVAYMRDTGLADYRATPGNLGALIAVRDLDDERAEVITLSWWPSMDAIRGFAGDDVERAVYYPQDDRYLLTTPEKRSALPIARRVRSAYARVGLSRSDPARHPTPPPHHVAAFGLVLDQRLRSSTCPPQPPCYWGRTATRRGRRRFGAIAAPAARSAISASA